MSIEAVVIYDPARHLEALKALVVMGEHGTFDVFTRIRVLHPSGSDEAAEEYAMELASVTDSPPLTRGAFELGEVGQELQTFADAVPEGNHLLVIQAHAAVTPAFLAMATMAMMPQPGITPFIAVGPVSERLRGLQSCSVPMAPEGAPRLFEHVANQGGNRALRADSLDHRVIMVSGDAFRRVKGFDVTLPSVRAILDDFQLRCIEARVGLPCALPGSYAAIFTGNPPGVAVPYSDPSGTTALMRKWKREENRCVALFLVQPSNPYHYQLLRQSLQSLHAGIHAAVILLVGDVAPFGQRKMKTPDDLHAKLSKVFDRLHVIPVSEDQIPASLPAHQQHLWLEQVGSIEVRKAGGHWVLAMVAGDCLEPESERDIRRAISHPNPLVTAFSVGVYDMIGDDVYRFDPPYGDAGDLSAAGDSSDFLLYRVGRSRHANTGARVSSLRILRRGRQDLSLAPDFQCNMIASQVPGHHHREIHFEQLCHEGTDSGDLLRWADWMHGLADCSLVVTRPVDGTTNRIRNLLELYAPHIHEAHGDAVDFAAWRNTFPPKPVGWRAFFDPDEAIDPLFDLLALRRMSDRLDVAAWRVKAINIRHDNQPTQSVSVRMFQAGPTFRGAVHESVSESVTGRIADCPILLLNRGGLDDPTHEKKRLYEQLCREAVEQDPTQIAQWVALSRAYAERGSIDEAFECLRHACDFSTDHSLAFSDRAGLYLHSAYEDLLAAVKRMPEGDHIDELRAIMQAIDAHRGVIPTVGHRPLDAIEQPVPVPQAVPASD